MAKLKLNSFFIKGTHSELIQLMDVLNVYGKLHGHTFDVQSKPVYLSIHESCDYFMYDYFDVNVTSIITFSMLKTHEPTLYYIWYNKLKLKRGDTIEHGSKNTISIVESINEDIVTFTDGSSCHITKCRRTDNLPTVTNEELLWKSDPFTDKDLVEKPNVKPKFKVGDILHAEMSKRVIKVTSINGRNYQFDGNNLATSIFENHLKPATYEQINLYNLYGNGYVYEKHDEFVKSLKRGDYVTSTLLNKVFIIDKLDDNHVCDKMGIRFFNYHIKRATDFDINTCNERYINGEIYTIGETISISSTNNVCKIEGFNDKYAHILGDYQTPYSKLRKLRRNDDVTTYSTIQYCSIDEIINPNLLTNDVITTADLYSSLSFANVNKLNNTSISSDNDDIIIKVIDVPEL